MRKFAIINSIGEAYELNDLRNFFHDPTGLGYTRRAEFAKIGNTYKILENTIEQPAPAGQICFKDEIQSPAYSKYVKFTRFLQKTPLTLIYKSDRAHKMEVIPEAIEKTEISKPLGLDISITFRALSLWYDEVEESGTSSANILSDSVEKCACHIEVTGTLTNPTWTQSVNGVQIASGQVTASIANGETLHIRTDTNPYQIYKESSLGVKTNLYSSSNFSTERFLLIREGKNVISCAEASSIKIKARLEYGTV